MSLLLCRDCKWRRSGLATGFLGNQCAHHGVSPVSADLVSGSTKQKRQHCEVARLRGQPCGVDGSMWEPR